MELAAGVSTRSGRTQAMGTLEQLAKDAESGDVEAQTAMGDAYRTGALVQRHLPTAMRWYLRAASRGHVAAQVHLGRLYMEDIEQGALKRNVNQARYWLKRAADGGSAEALHLSAQLLLETESPLFDPAGGLDLLDRACQLGSGAACNDLGLLLLAGVSVEPDPVRAFELFLRGARLGDTSAQCSVARCFGSGEGVAPDDAQAEHWYGEALAHGAIQASVPLALLLLAESRALADRERGMMLLTEAADHGDAAAQYHLAVRLQAAHPPEFLRALHYFHEAADQGHGEAMFKLATILYQGTELDRAYPEQAAPLYRRLAEAHRHGYAAQMLGVMHAQGNGVPRDIGRAQELFELAGRLGRDDALLNLALLRAAPSEHTDMVEAAKWAVLFDDRAASEESRELLRTLSGLLSDAEMADADQRAWAWRASAVAEPDGLPTAATEPGQAHGERTAA